MVEGEEWKKWSDLETREKKSFHSRFLFLAEILKKIYTFFSKLRLKFLLIKKGFLFDLIFLIYFWFVLKKKNK